MLPVDYDRHFSILYEIRAVLEEHKNSQGRVGNLLKTGTDNNYIILGDLHGDLEGLKSLSRKLDFESYLEKSFNKIMFLGDYIDRGANQLETLEYVLSLFRLNPEQVILIRGNHEGPIDLPVFPDDFKRKIRGLFSGYAQAYLDLLQDLFNNLLTAVIIDDKAALVHGGVPTQANNLTDLSYAHILHPKLPHLEEILWNDPMDDQGVKPSPRGAGRLFGPDKTKLFLGKIGVETLIRGHQNAPEGYKLDHGQVFTIFSSKTRT